MQDAEDILLTELTADEPSDYSTLAALLREWDGSPELDLVLEDTGAPVRRQRETASLAVPLLHPLCSFRQPELRPAMLSRACQGADCNRDAQDKAKAHQQASQAGAPHPSLQGERRSKLLQQHSS